MVNTYKTEDLNTEHGRQADKELRLLNKSHKNKHGAPWGQKANQSIINLQAKN